MTVWHLDLVRKGNDVVLAVLDPDTGMIELEPVGSPVDIVRALRNVMLRTVPNWPSRIGTDHAICFSGLGPAVGIEQWYLAPDQMRAVERAARRA